MNIRPIIITPDQKIRLEKLTQIVLKYKKILGLEEENIEIGISAKNTAFLFWYEERNTWGIYLLPSDNIFTPVHELGHIVLSKKTNYLYFARSGINRIKIFEGPELIINHLLDCFVDYNLIQVEGLYKLYIEDAHLWKDAKKKGKIKGKVIDIIHSYKALIGFYLSLKLIDKKKDPRSFIDVKNFLKKAKVLVRRSFPRHQFNFQSLEAKLDLFDEIKDSNDANIILDFFRNILCETHLWKESEIKEQMNFLFPR